MIPNIIWFSIPAPNDILRTESVTEIPDTIVSISQKIIHQHNLNTKINKIYSAIMEIDFSVMALFDSKPQSNCFTSYFSGYLHVKFIISFY